jgi:hypothetical protein
MRSWRYSQWNICGHLLTVLTFVLGISAWTAFQREMRIGLAFAAGFAQLLSMLCYIIGYRLRMNGGQQQE